MFEILLLSAYAEFASAWGFWRPEIQVTDIHEHIHELTTIIYALGTCEPRHNY